MEDVKLLGTWPSPFLYRVILALKLKGVRYEYVEENLFDKSDLLLQHNPTHKKIPVVVHGGKPIAESIVILEYIEEVWPQNPLLPKDPYERAAAQFWTKLEEDTSSTFFAFFQTVGEEQERATKEGQEVLRIIEEKGEIFWWGGNWIGRHCIWMDSWMAENHGRSSWCKADNDRFPHLQAWIESFKAVPVIKENLPDHNEMLAYFKQR